MNNFNFFSAIVTVTKTTIFNIVNTGGVTKWLGGVYSGLYPSEWTHQPAGYYFTGTVESRKNEFFKTFKKMFMKDGKVLYSISEQECEYFWEHIISDEVKNCYYKFHALTEGMQEPGKIYPRNLQEIYREKQGDHVKIFFNGCEYISPSIVEGKLSWVYSDGVDTFFHPENGKDFFCQDSDIEITSKEISIKDILESFEAVYLLQTKIAFSEDEMKELTQKSDLAKRFGRGAHRVALKKVLENHSFFGEPENRDLLFLLQYIK